MLKELLKGLRKERALIRNIQLRAKVNLYDYPKGSYTRDTGEFFYALRNLKLTIIEEIIANLEAYFGKRR